MRLSGEDAPLLRDCEIGKRVTLCFWITEFHRGGDFVALERNGEVVYMRSDRRPCHYWPSEDDES